jgi:hypothetical protein
MPTPSRYRSLNRIAACVPATLALAALACSPTRPSANSPSPVAAAPTQHATAVPTRAHQSAPNEPLLGCVHADFPAAWQRGTEGDFAGWVRDPVSGADGIPVFPFVSYFELPADAEPDLAFSRASSLLRELKPFDGGTRNDSALHSLTLTGLSADARQGGRDHLVYVMLVGCPKGRAQLVILDTTRDTAAQVDGEFRQIIQSMRASD